MSEKTMLSNIIFENPDRIEQPYSWIKHIPFAFFLIDVLRPEVVVELGVHTGNSFSAFCQAVNRLELKTKCYGVDTWEGDDQAGLYEGTVFDDLNGYVNEKYQDIAILLKMTFDEALDYFPDKSVDLLHIDGLHTYDAARKDYEMWLPKISDKGLVVIHDTAIKDDDYGVWKLWEEISSGYESFNFEHGYGLGIAVIGKGVNDRFRRFIDEINKNLIYQNMFRRLGELIFLGATQEKEPLTRLYVDCGKGFVEETSISKDSGMYEEFINVEWDLSKFSQIESLRWDPLEDKWCVVKLKSIIYQDKTGKKFDLDLASITNNGISRGEGWFFFETIDPWFFLPIQGKLESLSIRGKLALMDHKYIDAKYREKQLMTKLYMDCGKGFREETAIFTDDGMSSGFIDVTFDLSERSSIESLRWDPLEYHWCTVKLESVSYRDRTGEESCLDLDSIAHNGISLEDGWIVFKTIDPWFFLPIQGDLESLSIRGKLALMNQDTDLRYGTEGTAEEEDVKVEADKDVESAEIRNKDKRVRNVEPESEPVEGRRVWRLTRFFRRFLKLYSSKR